MEGFELKLDTATGTIAVGNVPPQSPLSGRSPRSSTRARLPPKSAVRSTRAAVRKNSAVGSALGQQAAAALLSSDAASPVRDEMLESTTSLLQPIKNPNTRSTKRLKKSASTSRKSTSSLRRSSSVRGTGRTSKKKRSVKSSKKLAQQREVEMYRSQLRTERCKSQRELESFRQQTLFLRHRHKVYSEDTSRELRDMRLKCHELEDKLASVSEELETTKCELDTERRRGRENRGDDFRDASSTRLNELEESARHLLFHVAEERRLRLHCAQCDIPLVSTHSEGPSTNDKPSSSSSSSSSPSAAVLREDEQLMVFYPCRHARFCAKCGDKMERCQVCSREIRSKVLMINSTLR